MTTNTNLIKKVNISKENLYHEHFFEDLFFTLIRENMLPPVEVEKAQRDLLNILAKEVQRYNRESSSSIKTEEAENLMASIYYALGIYFKEMKDLSQSADEIVTKGLEKILNEGRVLITKKVEKAYELLESIQAQKLVTKNYAYNDTVGEGLSLFFSAYDIEFAAHETPGSIDYFLFFTETEATGIEYIELYLEKLAIENKFCKQFDEQQIENLLGDYAVDYEHLLINIFEIVLANAIALCLLDKNPINLELTGREVECLKEKLMYLPAETLEAKLQQGAVKCCEEIGLEEKQLRKYVGLATHEITSLVKQRLDLGKLENVFIPANEQNRNYIDYMDGVAMTQKAFKALAMRIRDSETFNDKFNLLKANINCLTDLEDILAADCFFEDEFLQVFMHLQDSEIILLIANNPSLAAVTNANMKYIEKEWHRWFVLFLNQIDGTKKRQLIETARYIKL